MTVGVRTVVFHVLRKDHQPVRSEVRCKEGSGDVPLCVDGTDAKDDVEDDTETGGGLTKLTKFGFSGFPRSFSPMLGRSRMTGVQYCEQSIGHLNMTHQTKLRDSPQGKHP